MSSSISIFFFAFNFVLCVINAIDRMTSLCRDDVFHFQLKYVTHFYSISHFSFLVRFLVAFAHSDSFHSMCQCVLFDHQMNHNVSHRLISFDANTNRNILSFIASKCFEWDKRINQQMNERKLIEKCAHIRYISLILAWIHTIQPKYSRKKKLWNQMKYWNINICLSFFLSFSLLMFSSKAFISI